VSRDRLVLVDSDLCPTLACPGQVFDPAVNDGANAFQELDSGIREVFANLGRQAQVLPDLLQDFAAQAALVNGRLARILLSRFLFAHCASFSSTVRTRLSSRARTGTNVAIERGKPMLRRNVPTSTTNSSPFLNSPISLFVRSEEHTSELQSRGHLVCR